MANWNKLNKQFNDLIESMSTEDWESWAANKANRKAMRNSQMGLKAKLQEEKILISNLKGQPIINQSKLSSDYSYITISSLTGIVYPDNHNT